MSQEHVEAVFGPQWVQDALEHSRESTRVYRQALFALRRKLRAADPSLPDEYDGTAWQPIEAEYLEAA